MQVKTKLTKTCTRVISDVQEDVSIVVYVFIFPDWDQDPESESIKLTELVP